MSHPVKFVPTPAWENLSTSDWPEDRGAAFSPQLHVPSLALRCNGVTTSHTDLSLTPPHRSNWTHWWTWGDWCVLGHVKVEFLPLHQGPFKMLKPSRVVAVAPLPGFTWADPAIPACFPLSVQVRRISQARLLLPAGLSLQESKGTWTPDQAKSPLWNNKPK